MGVVGLGSEAESRGWSTWVMPECLCLDRGWLGMDTCIQYLIAPWPVWVTGPLRIS